MMRLKLFHDGSIGVPRLAEGDDGIIGDGIRIVEPNDPEYADLLRRYQKEVAEFGPVRA